MSERWPSPAGGEQSRKRKTPHDNTPTFKAAVLAIIARNRIDKIAATLTGVLPPVRRLCATCVSLNLSAEKFLVRPKHRSQPYRDTFRLANNRGEHQQASAEFGMGLGIRELGPLRTILIKSRGCPFCNLVLSSVQEQIDMQLTVSLVDDASSANPLSKIAQKAVCYASWQMDGRESVREKRRGSLAPSTRARTRRIRLHWNTSDFHDAYVILIADTVWARNSQHLGRHMESSKANVTLVKSWIDLCHNSHGHPNLDDVDDIRRPYFGVINVQTMCLTALPANARYVALSYTWGLGERFTTTQETIAQLQVPNGIAEILDQVPCAIRDAINFVRNLKETYLWVDSLCIVQDSKASWDLNAKHMDKIYGNAYFTICAADGPDGNTGLIGLDPSQRRISQHIEKYAPGVTLMVSHLAETFIQRSTWNSRAWTFQERLLSKRCIIFAEGRVWFQCHSNVMSEDIIEEQKDAGTSIELLHSPLHMLSDLDNKPLRVYTKSLELYTARNLTKSEDILAAFNGISNLLGKALNANLLYGLPNSHFDWALLWEPTHALVRREPTMFPSWSWCGWMDNSIEYKTSTISGTTINLHEWLMEHTWIVWYIRDGDGCLRLLLHGSADSPSNSKKTPNRWQGYEKPNCNATDSKCDQYGRAIKYPDWAGATFTRTLPEFPFSISITDSSKVVDTSRADTRFLQFFTMGAMLYLAADHRAPLATMGRGLRRYNVVDYAGDWCGTIVLNGEWGQRTGLGREHEFIAISEAKDFSEEEYDSWTYYIPKEREQSEWDLFYVLLIEYDGIGVAHRVGLGKVYKEAFFDPYDSSSEWKEYILG